MTCLVTTVTAWLDGWKYLATKNGFREGVAPLQLVATTRVTWRPEDRR